MKKITSAIIVAGGVGKRFKSDVPKQFLSLEGKPVIIHTLEKFENSANIDAIVIVCVSSYIRKMDELLAKFNPRKIHTVVPGGETRQVSSYNGLKACPEGTEYVLIHDAVRPFVEDKTITAVLKAAVGTGAATAAITINDTVVEEEGGVIKRILDRKALKRVQTPQAFNYEKILTAHEDAARKNKTNFTDDCGLIINSGSKASIVKGSELNVKITTVSDMISARGGFL
jgi:2-C-methyl-D-erythritol 4-phosphate cytidylyltransferase